MSDADAVAGHYASQSLEQRVSDALAQAGLGAVQLAWADLAPLDQFHVRGLAATQELAAALGPSSGMSVLDVGSGLGGPSRFLAATYGCRVIGVDLTQAFVDVAEMLARRTGLAGLVSYRQADALMLPFEDISFDAAWTQHAAMNIADRPRLYGEVHRVLKPGGRFAIYDVTAGNGEPLHFPVPWARSPETSFLVTADGMRAALERSGFSIVSWNDESESAVAWFEQQRPPGNTGSQSFGLPVVMGPDFPQMSGNLRRNLTEGRVRLVQAVVSRV